jgi:hypothetical protein
MPPPISVVSVPPIVSSSAAIFPGQRYSSIATVC